MAASRASGHGNLPGAALAAAPRFDPDGIHDGIQCVRRPLALVRDPLRARLGVAVLDDERTTLDLALAPGLVDAGRLPALYPEWLGDRGFSEVHGTRFPYVVGEMANGLTTVRAVVAAARAGFVGFFGAAGLVPERIEAAVVELASALGDGAPWGSNLIHSPNEPALEAAAVDIYLRHRVPRISASAFTGLTLPLVRYAASGLRVDASGRVQRRQHVLGKVSRPEVARAFLSPAPADMLQALVDAGQLSPDEARLAQRVPLVGDLTVEADSGGHTDNRPLAVIFPVIAALRDQLAAVYVDASSVRLGAAGGLGCPAAVSSAFALGAAYVLTGSVNQAAVESGLGAEGKRMLAEADLADVAMAPSADMFELGVQVQVLRRGSLFAQRARRLYQLHQACPSVEALPAADRRWLESEIFQQPVERVWDETRAFWSARDPAQLALADQDPHHRLALLCRWYLGQASRWAIADVASRRSDFQIWCGPAQGAFNAWVRGSFLEPLAERSVAQIGLNLLEGAAVITRAQSLRSLGLPVSARSFAFAPRPLA